MLNNYDGEIVLLHNHPASSRPSIDDLKSLHKHNAIASVVVGHNGALWLVKYSYRLENIEEYEKWYNYFRINKQEDKLITEVHIMDEIYKKVRIYEGRTKGTGQGH